MTYIALFMVLLSLRNACGDYQCYDGTPYLVKEQCYLRFWNDLETTFEEMKAINEEVVLYLLCTQ